MGLNCHGFVLLDLVIGLGIAMIAIQGVLIGVRQIQMVNHQLIQNEMMIIQVMQFNQQAMIDQLEQSGNITLCEYELMGRKSAYVCKK